ncbi:MAG: NapC/NirT family cytochrome c [Candidatus Coatesbacteria bacterium]|nr:MAG: NapC/NirT family cytochrome c [Candidatus Coatesbacteria bacterium]
MANIVKDLWGVVLEHSLGIKRFLLGTAVVFVAVLLIFFQISESPHFCIACHIMKPYYESWEESSHNEVNCLECHYEPGAVGYFEGKYAAISQVAKYFTGTYGTRFWAEIEDSSCLRGGCHQDRLLAGNVDYLKGIRFDHAAHLGELRRGKKLKCTSCHSSIVIGSHITVTESVCFTCHFKKSETGEDISDCTLCHGWPTGVTKYLGIEFDHAEYTDRGVACTKCHTGVTMGDGAVQPRACVRCHPDRTLEADTSDELHTIHITEHKVECFECHDEILHGRHEVSPLLSPDCAGCHGDMHSVQEEIYIGTGGIHATGAADPMFAAGVGCTGCHTGAIETPGHAGSPAHFPAADANSCTECHSVLYEPMLSKWQSDTKTHFRDAEWIVADAERKVAPYTGTPSGGQALELVAGAGKNLDLVADDASWGAHNVVYTNELIRAAVTDSDKAVKLLGFAGFDTSGFVHATAPDETCAERCHFGVEHTRFNLAGDTFAHYNHVFSAGLFCTECHDVERHGATLDLAYDCSSCHHVKGDADCSSCHSGYQYDTLSYRGKTFKHAPHLDEARLDCRICHPLNKPASVSVGCIDCHHEDKERSCSECHPTQARMYAGTGGRGVEDTPSVMPSLKCRSCHTNLEERPTSETCTKCHKPAYASIFSSWQKGIGAKADEVATLLAEVKAVKSELAGITIDGESALTLYENARANHAYVMTDATYGAHNQKYANALLSKSAEDLNKILEATAE